MDDPRNVPGERAAAPSIATGPQQVVVRILPSWLGLLAMAAGGALLLAAMTLGGYAQGKGDTVVHVLAVMALGLSLMLWHTGSLNVLQKATFGILIAALVIAALHLMPLPVRVFAHLPERGRVLEELRSAGLDIHWIPMTLDPVATARSLLALLSFLAMWMLCTILPREARVKLLKLGAAAAVPMALFGFVQASRTLDTTGARGLFENRNHYATMMAMLLPFALAAGRQALERNTVALAVAWHGAAAAMLLAAALSFSRVGSVLAALSALAAFALLGGGRALGSASRRNAALISLALAAAAAGYFASDRLLRRFGSNMLEDLRWQYFENGWEVMGAYFPWGSGMGAFRVVYAQFEPLQSLGEFTYANHAHNELLQNTIEGGLPALALMLLFVGVVVASTRAIVSRGRTADYWQRAALVSVYVPLLHSLVDYPLRTLACSLLLALALAVLVSGRRTQSSRPPGQNHKSTGNCHNGEL